MDQRFHSLDVFRGATVALMILVNNPGSWSHIYPPLRHADWHGCTPTDLVFPFFLFAVGNALAFVLPKLETAGEKAFWYKIIKRTLIIFCVGLFINWFPFIKYSDAGDIIAKPFETLRIYGVLQRIAICYFFAAVIIHYLKAWDAFVFVAFILLGYWFLSYSLNTSDPYSITGWFGTRVDAFLIGENHMYHGEGIAFDPEGLMNSFAAIVQVVFGYLAGNYILKRGLNAKMMRVLCITGAVFVITGLFWNLTFPINKKIWTSSYTIYTTGLALLILAILVYLLEFKKGKGIWSHFFDVFGKNALFIFALSGLLPRLLGLIRIPGNVNTDGKQLFLTPFGWFYEHICKPVLPSDPRIGSLIYAICFIVMMWFLAWVLDRKKIYIKV